MKKLLILILILINLTAAAETTVSFGRYWQEDRETLTPIEWLVLDETDDSYLLLSKYCLDANRFGSMLAPCFWKNSDVRTFLNNFFYNKAFSSKEKTYIVKTHLYTPKNRIYANNLKDFYTDDNVFLLTIEEVEHYLPLAEMRIAYATPYAQLGFSKTNWSGAATGKNGTAYWWLRSNGVTEYYGAFVNVRGLIVYEGEMVYAPHYALRPAIWVSKEAFNDGAET